MPLGINEDIFRLHIPVRDPLLLMQKLQDQDDFRGVELRCLFVEAAGSA